MHETRCIPWIVIVTVMVLVLSYAGLGQKAQAPATPPPKTSDRDAFKIAATEEDAGRLEVARAYLLFAIDKKKRPEYDTALARVHGKLADLNAEAGEKALKSMDFQTCEKQLKAAQGFATTDRVNALESEYKRVTNDLLQKYAAARKRADDGDPEGALPDLQALIPHVYILKDVKAEIARVILLWVEKLLAEGENLVSQHLWSDASVRFQQVEKIAPGNPRTKEGLERLSRGHYAFDLFAAAQSELERKEFRKALQSTIRAIGTYSEAREVFEPLRKRITEDWIMVLLEETPSLLMAKDDFEKTRDGYLRLQQVLALDSNNQQAQTLMAVAKDDIGTNCLEHATQLEGRDAGLESMRYQSIATACVLTLTAQELVPDLVKPQDLKDAAQLFNRKRTSQLLLSVDNLAPQTEPEFVKTVQDNARHSLENLGFPDLRIRLKDEYEKSDQKDDPLLQDVRPDSMSQTVLLTIGIKEYESVRRHSEKPEQVDSQYVCGKETKPNPIYQNLQAELEKIRRALEDPKRKKDKPTKEGYTERTYMDRKDELSRVRPEIEVDRLCPYTYQKISYNQHTNLKFSINVRDYGSKEVIKSDEIAFPDVPREAVEITGVKDGDVNHLQNASILLISEKEVLDEAKRRVLSDLEKKIPELLKRYTDRFYKEGEDLLAAKKVDEAVEAFLCYWAFHRGKLDQAQGGPLTSSQAEALIELVKARTGFDLIKNGEALRKALITTPTFP